MGTDLVVPDWPALSEVEVRDVLAHFDLGRGARVAAATVTWRSPRPMSAGALVRVGGRAIFLKRHHVAVRTVDRLEAEHRFARHLRSRGQPVPEVLEATTGASVYERGPAVYEAHAGAEGVDLYRDVPSWYPFRTVGHARSAGRALAHFHHAAADFVSAAWPIGVLVGSVEVITAPDPLAAVAAVVARRPGRARAPARDPRAGAVGRYRGAPRAAAAPYLRGLRAQWTHGDWHASNLTWSTERADATVTNVLDLGLSNRTFALHDLAVAIERNVIDWLDVGGVGSITVDERALDALLEGYDEVVPLSSHDLAAIAAILPIAHVEFALSEVEYFGDVVHSATNSALAYHDYLLGHARWFARPDGTRFLERLRGTR